MSINSSEETALIETYDIPIDPEFNGDGPHEVRFAGICSSYQYLISGIDWAVSSPYYKRGSTFELRDQTPPTVLTIE